MSGAGGIPGVGRGAAGAAGARLRLGLALSAVIGALLLVAMGGIVRTTGYGLGCPDWPLCYGRVIPPALTGAWVEFSHRLLGGVVAVQVVLVGLLAWRERRQAPRVAWPALAAVLLLGVQALLGGLHVLLEIPPLTGLIHTATAMLLLGLLAWHLAARVAPRSGLRLGRRSWWPAAAAVATYLLLLSGSYVSRSGAALACPAFPACGAPAAVARGLVHTQMLHRFLALAVAIVAGAALATVWRKTAAGWVRGLVVGLALLLLVQGGLGVANVLLRLPIWSRVLHLVTAAALWAGFVFLWGLPGAREGET